jgi:hypothetical protein
MKIMGTKNIIVDDILYYTNSKRIEVICNLPYSFRLYTTHPNFDDYITMIIKSKKNKTPVIINYKHKLFYTKILSIN